MSLPDTSDTVRSLLESRAVSTPEAPFVTFDDLDGRVESLSYIAFDRAVNQTADLLSSLGLGPGDRVCLVLDNGPEFLFVWFAAAKLGSVIVPANTASPAAELEYLVDHSDSKLIVAQAAHADTVRQVAHRCPRVEVMLTGGAGSPSPTGLRTLLAGRSDTPPAGPGPSPDDEAAILYTSGTTARPKGVLVTHANYVCAGETVARAIRLTPEDRHLVVLPLFHGNAQYYSTMSALVRGASLALMARFSASRFFDQAITHGCTVSSLFAAPIRMLLAQDARPELLENRLRVVLFAQNVTPAQLAEWDERFDAPLLQLWGMTETMGPPVMNPIDGERRNMSMGRPTVGYDVRLVDDNGQPVPPGDVGQIIVGGVAGRTLMKGYYKNAAATSETLRDGWLWSGDNARQDADGFLHFVDRRKDMIKRAGENVAASEVEAVIRDHPGVFDCAVVGVPDDVRDEAIVAVVVPYGPESDRAPTGDDILRWCRERLARFRVPQRVVFRTELPRTSVGKIQKHVLRAELRAPDAPRH